MASAQPDVSQSSSSGATVAPLPALPPLGQELRCTIRQETYLRYGSSLRILSEVSEVFHEEFRLKHLDLGEEWEKMKQANRMVIMFVLENAFKQKVTCMRAMLDNNPTLGSKRFIIQYLFTPEQFRGRGFASAVVGFSLSLARGLQTDIYVESLEDAATFWMKFGFILEQDPDICEQFNTNTDTHLLKMPGNKTGSKITDYIPQSSGDEEEDEDGDASGNEMEQDEDEDLQQALAASIGQTYEPGSTGASFQPQDDELQRALMMSLQQQPASLVQPEDQKESDDNMDEEDDDLAKAIALSME